MSENEKRTLVEVRDLKQYFDVNVGMFKTRPLKAVDGVSFSIKKGETLGLVGESGCGKTTVGRTLLHLYTPTAGEILFDGKPVKTKEDILNFRKKATMVFQDPYSSLNPRMTVSDIIGEPLDIHRMYADKQQRHDRILELMEHDATLLADGYEHPNQQGCRQIAQRLNGVIRVPGLRPSSVGKRRKKRKSRVEKRPDDNGMTQLPLA